MVSNGREEVVKILLDNGADVHADDESALFAALEGHHKDLVEVLLRHGANPNANSKDGSPLNLAVSKNQTDLAKILLGHGASLNDGTEDCSALHHAFTGKHREINSDMIRLLLQHGATPSVDHLHHAALIGAVAALELFINHGLDIEQPGSDFGSAMMAAVCGGDERACELMLKHGAKSKVEGRDDAVLWGLLLDECRYTVKICGILRLVGYGLKVTPRIVQAVDENMVFLKNSNLGWAWCWDKQHRHYHSVPAVIEFLKERL